MKPSIYIILKFFVSLFFFSCSATDDINEEDGIVQNDEVVTPPDNEDVNCTGQQTGENETIIRFEPGSGNSEFILEDNDDFSRKFIYNNGSFICTGTFNETSFLGNGNTALYSVNEEFELNWMFPKKTGKFYDVIHTSDNHYVAAGRLGDNDFSKIYVVKVNLNGELVWEYFVDAEGDQNLGASATTVVESSEGTYVIAGNVSVNSDIFGFGNKSFILSLNQEGVIQWSKPLGNGAEPADLIINSNDNFVAVLSSGEIFVNEVDFSGNLIKSNSFGSSDFDGVRDIIQLSDGNYVITGFTTGNDGDVNNNKGNADAWLLKLDSSFNLIKEQTLGGFGYQYGVATVERADKSLLMFGETSNSNIFVDSSWNNLWFVELTPDFCIIEWTSRGLVQDYNATDFIWLEDTQEVVVFASSDWNWRSNTRKDYDHYIARHKFKSSN